MQESGKNLCFSRTCTLNLVLLMDELPEDECLLKPILYQDSHSWKTKKTQICNSNSKCQISYLMMFPELVLSVTWVWQLFSQYGYYCCGLMPLTLAPRVEESSLDVLCLCTDVKGSAHYDSKHSGE